MRILLTGGTGFIGSHLLPELASEHEVFALARDPAQTSDAGAEWIEHDLASPLDTARLPKRVDAVIHLAQSKLYRNFPDGAADVFGINLASTFQLLQYAREAGVSSFLYASTGGVYGSGSGRLSETARLNPLNFYLSSKYGAEALLTSYQAFFRTLIFRFFFVYGPGQQGMLLPTLVAKVRDGEPITIEGNPGIRINPIFVADAVHVFEPALSLESSDLFNVAGDEIVSLTDIVHLIEGVVGRRAVVEHADKTGGGDLIGDNQRMKEVLGVKPRTPLEQGLMSMVQASV